MATEKSIGVVTHYFNHLEVAIVKFNKEFKKGGSLKFRGHTTDFTQKIDEMQYEHAGIEAAKKGQEVGIKVKDNVREGDSVYEA